MRSNASDPPEPSRGTAEAGAEDGQERIAEGYPAGTSIQFADLSAEEQAGIERYVVDTLLDCAVTGEPEK